MGTTLTGTTIKTTYDSLIKVTDNGPLSGTAKYLSDGLGNDSKLALGTSGVGIGTTTPPTIFGVEDTNANIAVINVIGTSPNYIFDVRDDGTSVFRVTGAGLVGIGTSAPDYELQVGDGTATETINIKALNTNPSRLFFSDTDAIGQGRIHYEHGGDYMNFWTDNSERMRIDSTGNVGIGTSTPAQKLRIKAGNGDQLGLDNAGERFTQISFLNNAAQKAAIWLDETVDEFVIYAAAGYTTPIYANAIERVRVTNNGLTFNGDTAAANALDDYEEGTFTPVMVGATFTLTTALGYYTKIGRQVSIWVEIEGTYSSPTAVFRVSSLPFTQAGGRAEGVFAAINGISFGGYCSAEILGTVMYLESHASGTGANRTDMNSTFFNAAGFRFMVSATYFV
jgi:hypothetical protein